MVGAALSLDRPHPRGLPCRYAHWRRYMTYRVPNRRPPHGGFWWIFVGWWWWPLIGWWWKPLKGMLFTAPAAGARGLHNSRVRRRALEDMQAAVRPPAAQTAPVAAPPGWYPDPDGLPVQRWWDGTKWTEQTQPVG